MLSFSQCDIFSQLLHNWLCNNVYSISATYTYGNVYNYTTQYSDFAVYICLPFHNVNIFHTLLYNCLYDNVYIESSLLHTVLYTITPPNILTVLFTFAFLFTMWYFFTITAQLTLQQCLQHILNIYLRYCLQIHYLSIVTLLLHMLSYSQYDIFSQLLHNWFYNNVYSISSTYTYGTVYNYSTSRLTLLFIYASFSQCDIFSQLLHNWLCNNVYSISATYTHGIVYN